MLVLPLLLMISAGAHARTTTENDIRPFVSDPVFGSFHLEIYENNPELQRLRARWRAEIARAEVSDALPDPRLSAGLYLQEVETRVGPQQYRLGISQVLPWKGKLSLKREMAASDAAALYQQYMDRQQALFATFKRSLARFIYLDQSLQITKEHVSLLAELEAQMEARYVTDQAGFSDWVRIQVETERLRDRVVSLRELKRPVASELNRLLGRPVNQAITVDVDQFPDLPMSLPMDRAHLVALMKQNNHAVHASTERIAAAQKGRDLARKNFYPDFTVGLDFIQTGSARMDGIEDSGRDPVVLKFGMSLPLNKKKYRSLETAAGEVYVSAVKEQVTVSDTLISRIDRLLYDYEDAVRKVKLYTDHLIPDTRDALNVLLRAYEVDATGFLDLIDTERTLLTLQLAMAESRTNGCKALAGLEEIAGTPLWAVPVGHPSPHAGTETREAGPEDGQ